MVDDPVHAQGTLYIEYSEFGESRKNERHVTDDEVRFVLQNSNHEYKNGRNTVYRATLPDGRNIKVQKMTESDNPAYIVDVIVY